MYPRARSASRGSAGSKRSNHSLRAPGPSLTPSQDRTFEACAATASQFLYAQRNVILCLHYDTLAINSRFERHRDDVKWIEVDNQSEQGAGRLVVSYDSSQTTIVWDLMTNEEVARFAAYEDIRVAAWMRNGNIAFGNSQGNVILFEPSTKEHFSSRTIFDPITALAPSTDCRTFAIGYLNGSILIASLQPQFTILHTLSTTKSPSPINQLGWHGSSSKQKSDMLASQTMDGDLRVWSVPKGSTGEAPTVIRTLQQVEYDNITGPCWFGWSKLGRIVQYVDGATFIWDVRTKRVTRDSVPTIDGVVGIANYGPQATLFTLGREHTVQQYDLNPTSKNPMLVKNVQHVPANVPPSPPISDGAQAKASRTVTAGPSDSRPRLPVHHEPDTSEDETRPVLSPLQRIARDADKDFDPSELRDEIRPLSPASSKSSQFSRPSVGRSKRSYPTRWDRTQKLRPNSPGIRSASSRTPSTTFSSASSSFNGFARSSGSRNSLRDPNESNVVLDLFPFVKVRLTEVRFRPPQYDGQRTPDDLRRQLLSVVFGWDDDIEALIRDELSRHNPTSPSAMLLSKWLGDFGTDISASLVGSESMTSADWMLLALSAMGQDSQKKIVGDAYVQRLVQKGDVHPAVAILLGLGEHNEAIEVYVSRKYYLEAVLLTCLLLPADWQRQSFLVRKMGETAISNGQPELAVRCFAVAGVESTEPWFSPNVVDPGYVASQMSMGQGLDAGASPVSPPTSANPNRLAPSQAGLKLITNFSNVKSERNDTRTAKPGKTPVPNTGITPIDTAFSPALAQNRPLFRDPISALTATPGGFTSKRMTSRDRLGLGTTPIAESATTALPVSAVKFRRRDRSSSATSKGHVELPGPDDEALARIGKSALSRNSSRDRKPTGLHVETDTRVVVDSSLHSDSTAISFDPRASRLSPAPTEYSMSSSKIDAIDGYINSVEEATYGSRSRRASSASRGPTGRRAGSKAISEPRGGSRSNYIKPGKRSPSSPISMSPDDPALRVISNPQEELDEGFYKIPPSATESSFSRRRGRSKNPTGDYTQPRSASKVSRRAESTDRPRGARSQSTIVRQSSPERGRSRPRDPDLERRGSPSSPVPMSSQAAENAAIQEITMITRDMSVGSRTRDQSIGARARSRTRAASTDPMAPRERSRSVRPSADEPGPISPVVRTSSRQMSRSRMPKLQTNFAGDSMDSRDSTDGKKFQAAQELEAARLMLTRRPSAPPIPHPSDLVYSRSTLSATEPSAEFYASPFLPEQETLRSHTADPEAVRKLGMTHLGTSTLSVPIGLPATPRAMRHPKYMTADPTDNDDVPSVPEIPINLVQRGGEQQKPAGEQLFLLPASTFQPMGRAASAPPEKYQRQIPIPQSSSRQENVTRPTHQRLRSLDAVVALSSGSRSSQDLEIDSSVGEVLESSVIIIDEGSGDLSHSPILLPELQHLAGPPPPPPPPPPSGHTLPDMGRGTGGSLGVINIAIDEKGNANKGGALSPSMPGDMSPVSNRRGRNSIDTTTSVGSKLRNVRDRFRDRSGSRSRTKSPTGSSRSYVRSPYESIPQPPPPPPPPPLPPFERMGSCPPQILRQPSAPEPLGGAEPLLILPQSTYTPRPRESSSSAPRNPMEIRAQMSTEHLEYNLEARGVSAGPDSVSGHRRRSSSTTGFRNNELRANMPPMSVQPGVMDNKF